MPGIEGYCGGCLANSKLVTFVILISDPGNLEDLKNGYAGIEAYIFLCAIFPYKIISLIYWAVMMEL